LTEPARTAMVVSDLKPAKWVIDPCHAWENPLGLDLDN